MRVDLSSAGTWLLAFSFRRNWVAALAVFCAGSTWGNEARPLPLTGIELSPLDHDAIAFGTFQSHNQKVVCTRRRVSS